MHMERYREGIRLFNHGEFFDAHEVLEDVWRAAPETEKRFLQGLIQVAVALHHHSKGNLIGARSLMGRAAKNLSVYPEQFGGIQLGPLRQSLTLWQEACAEGAVAPPMPRVNWLDEA